MSVEVKQKEARTLKFTITDSNGSARDCSSATCEFGVKKYKSDSAYVLHKTDSDFTKTDAVIGILKLPLSTSDLDIAEGKYVAELKVAFAADDIQKFDDIEFIVIKSVVT